MRYRNATLLLAFCWLAVNGFAAEITGTVTNGTIGKPAVGVEVVLLSHAGNSMDEVGKVTTDAQGHFRINVPDPDSQHLLRVTHQGVNYSQNVTPGTSNVDITIFDSAQQVAGIFEEARVYRLQAENGQLEVKATYNLRNESTPPRTRMSDETYEVELPAGAQLIDASAAGPGGMALPTSPVPTGKNNRYALVFPIRPGRSEVMVTYRVPYNGSFEFSLTPDSQLSELGVLLPKSMQLNGLTREFSRDPNDEEGLAVFFAKDVPAHALVKFSVSGQGVAPREAQGGDVPQSSPSGPETPVTTHSNTIWYVVAGMVIIVAVGGFWLWRRVRSDANGAARSTTPANKTSARPRVVHRTTSGGSQAGVAAPDTVLEALKDELFQLEKDRLDGKVSPEDHAKLKAGLDALIRRHLKKSGQ